MTHEGLAEDDHARDELANDEVLVARVGGRGGELRVRGHGADEEGCGVVVGEEML